MEEQQRLSSDPGLPDRNIAEAQVHATLALAAATAVAGLGPERVTNRRKLMSAESSLIAVAVDRALLNEDAERLAVLLPDGLPGPGRELMASLASLTVLSVKLAARAEGIAEGEYLDRIVRLWTDGPRLYRAGNGRAGRSLGATAHPLERVQAHYSADVSALWPSLGGGLVSGGPAGRGRGLGRHDDLASRRRAAESDRRYELSLARLRLVAPAG